MIKVIVNNKEMEIENGVTVGVLLESRNMTKAAVWINGRQLKRAEYDSWEIQQGDKVKILRIVAGG